MPCEVCRRPPPVDPYSVVSEILEYFEPGSRLATFAPVASIIERERRVGMEECAKLAEQWRDENKMKAAKARKSVSEGSRSMAEQLDGAAIECNALAQEIRKRIEEKTNVQ